MNGDLNKIIYICIVLYLLGRHKRESAVSYGSRRPLTETGALKNQSQIRGTEVFSRNGKTQEAERVTSIQNILSLNSRLSKVQ